MKQNHAKLITSECTASRVPVNILAITTGMRQDEILGLQWEDVDLEKGNLAVRHAIQLLQARITVGDPKSAGSRRTIARPKYTVAVLLLHQEKTGKDKGLLFTISSGKPVSPCNLSRHIHQVLDRTGLPKSTSMTCVTRPQHCF